MKTLALAILATLGIVACGGSATSGPSLFYLENYPDQFVMDFPCTEDMAPVITCLDQGVFQDNPQQEDIWVGQIVMVNRTCDDSSELGRLGRVMGIETVDGQPGYRLELQGTFQNPFHPDPFRECIIPHDAVEGRLIDVRWNVFPERVPLWSLVKHAKREVKEAVAFGYQTASQLRGERAAAKTSYVQKFEGYCGYHPISPLKSCSPTLGLALELDNKYAEYRRLQFIGRYSFTLDRAELYWNCAYGTAENADYSGGQLRDFDCDPSDYRLREGYQVLWSAPCLAVSPEISRKLTWHGPYCR